MQLLNDAELEFDETITVTLSNPTGGATFLNGQQMQVTILDDEWAAMILENKLPLFDDNFRFHVSAVAVQSDGKVLLGGWSNGVEGPILEGDPADVGLIRLHADLSRDLTFKAKLGGRYLGFPAEGVIGLALQLDGKILVSTTSWVEGKEPGARGRPGLARLNLDGSVDWSFNVLDHFRSVSAGNFGSAAVVPLSDGAILAAGWFETSESDGFGGLVRLKSDGSLDPTFTRFPSMPERFSRQSDGRIILVVAETQSSPTSERRILRLNPNGTPDSSFTTSLRLNAEWDATRTRYSRQDLLVQPDDKIVIRQTSASGPYFNWVSNDIVRLNSDGSIDPAFRRLFGGGPTVHGRNSIAIQPHGRILAGAIGRLNSDGSSDRTFDLGAWSGSNSIYPLPGGSILVLGEFSLGNSEGWSGVARLKPASRYVRLVAPVRKAGGTMTVNFAATPGFRYALETTTDFKTWLPLRTNMASGLMLEFDDPDAASFPRRFYRARLVSP